MTKIKVYEAIMGNGKTKRIIEDLRTESRPVIYITPLLSEVYRVSGAVVNDKGVHQKDDLGNFMYDLEHPLASKQFMLPNNRNRDGSKLTSIKSLISNRCNICSTHTLFSMFDLELLDCLKKNNYVLIVDEALEVWRKFYIGAKSEDEEATETGMTKTDKDIQTLITNGFIEVDPVGLLHWQSEKFINAENTIYQEVKRLCDLKRLYLSNGKVVFWELNHTVLSAFSEVVIATYMFEYSFMSHYLKIHGFDYGVERFGAVPSDYKKHVKIVQGKMNDVGNKDFSLSYSDLSGRKDRGTNPDTMRKQLFNFLNNQCKVKSSSENFYWTTYKKSIPSVSGGRFKKRWIAYNTKATNDYRDSEYVAYLCNNFPSTYLVQMVTRRSGNKFNQDLWALSEMLQFLFRSKLRCYEEDRLVTLYIPSKRMRELLEWWLEQDTHEVVKQPPEPTK